MSKEFCLTVFFASCNIFSRLCIIHVIYISISVSHFSQFLFRVIFTAKFLLSSAKIFSPWGKTTTKLLRIIIYNDIIIYASLPTPQNDCLKRFQDRSFFGMLLRYYFTFIWDLSHSDVEIECFKVLILRWEFFRLQQLNFRLVSTSTQAFKTSNQPFRNSFIGSNFGPELGQESNIG